MDTNTSTNNPRTKTTSTWEPLPREKFNTVRAGDTIRKTTIQEDVTHTKTATLATSLNGIWYTAQGHIALHPNPHPSETHEILRG